MQEVIKEQKNMQKVIRTNKNTIKLYKEEN